MFWIETQHATSIPIFVILHKNNSIWQSNKNNFAYNAIQILFSDISWLFQNEFFHHHRLQKWLFPKSEISVTLNLIVYPTKRFSLLKQWLQMSLNFSSHSQTVFMFFPSSYDNKEIALNCGIMLRECIKFPALAK